MFVVLDVRLPPRLAQISEVPEGSRSNPLKPDQEVVGTISSARGEIDVAVERVTRGSKRADLVVLADHSWSVPALYEEVMLGWGDRLPRFLTGTRWQGSGCSSGVVLLGMPLFYLLTVR